MLQPTVSLEQGVAIVDQIAKVFEHEVRRDQVRELLTGGDGATADDMGVWDFVFRLGQVVKYGDCGIWLDHSEGFLFEDQRDRVVQACLRRHDELPGALFNTRGERINIEDELVRFDEWLRDHSLRHRQERVDHGEHPTIVNMSLKQVRLLQIDTGADYCVVIAHPERECERLAAMLADIGVSSRRVIEDTAEQHRLWHVPSTKTLDVAERYLRDYHEFEVIEHIDNEERGRRSAALRRWVDDDHAVIVNLSESSHAAIDFGFIRRDVAEMFADLIPETFDETSPTVQSRGALSNESVERWAPFTDAEDVIAYLDKWVPEHLALANLAFLTEYLESDASKTSQIPAEGWNRAMNRMLGGWQDHYESLESDETFMDPWGITERFNDWVAENPNGTR